MQGAIQFAVYLTILANGNDLAMIINYDHNHSFIVLASVITIVNYKDKTFIVQATGTCTITLFMSAIDFALS